MSDRELVARWLCDEMGDRWADGAAVTWGELVEGERDDYRAKADELLALLHGRDAPCIPEQPAVWGDA